MSREIVFDTETTGFEYAKGERLVEIGAVELINHVPTGVTYHQYINPEKEVQTAEEAIAGAKDILAEFISDEADYRIYIRNITVEEGKLICNRDEDFEIFKS